MVGMLDAAFVLRRRDQNPSSIVTALTGRGFNRANGDLEKLATPASCQAASETPVESGALFEKDSRPSPIGIA
jgi:hypothetical protein